MRIAIDSPTAPDVLALLREHLADMVATSPPESVQALDTDALTHPSITFWTARDDDDLLLGCGALKQHDAVFGEVKSMRTATSARGRGVASAILQTVIDECAAQGIRTLALETGSEDFFKPARRMYRKHGFRECGPFADYTNDPNSTYFVRAVSG